MMRTGLYQRYIYISFTKELCHKVSAPYPYLQFNKRKKTITSKRTVYYQGSDYPGVWRTEGTINVGL